MGSECLLRSWMVRIVEFLAIFFWGLIYVVKRSFGYRTVLLAFLV